MEKLERFKNLSDAMPTEKKVELYQQQDLFYIFFDTKI